jgi:UDP-N-acetylglucosamine--N-acetylmuramyl-(pentapeptide) pyrophosphoryl-undecaprenol N-acetylglucosamine transferase
MGVLAAGTLSAICELRRMNARIVVGFGGYPSLPVLAAARVLGLPIVLHEQNAVAGRANRLFAAAAARIGVSFEAPRGLEGANRPKLVVTGNPVRPAIAAVAGTPYAAPDAEGEIRLLVFGGSQGAAVFGSVVPNALARLDHSLQPRLCVVQQCRADDLDRVAKIYREAGIRAELNTFFDDMPERLAAAHLVIARAGASTIAELGAVGRPAILVPLPTAADDHQTANAERVAAAGAGWLIRQSDLAPVALAQCLDALLLGDGAALAAAAAAARRLGVPDAARRLADLVLAALRNAQLPTEAAA